MDASASGRSLAPGATVKFLDASLNWNDWNAFIAGAGDIYSDVGDGSNGVVINSKGLHTGKNYVEFIGEVKLDMAVTGTSATLHVRSEAIITISHDIVRTWYSGLVDWIESQRITTNHNVWPLIQIEPQGHFLRWIWQNARNPDNEQLARAMTTVRRSKNSAVKVKCRVFGSMAIKTSTEYHL